jgi:sugar lactone lactonase YvrE
VTESPAEPRILIDDLVFGEGPRFRDGKLFVSDQHGREVLTVDLEGRRGHVAQVEQMPSGLGWLPDGTLLIVSMRDRKLLALRDGSLRVHADLGDIAGGHCNDMVVDAHGRAYVGNFGFDMDAGADPAPAKLAMITPQGEVRVVADDLMFPNGTVITPDGKTLIIAETYAARLTAFDVLEDGSLDSRRVWAQLPCPPDGICLDAEGCVWVSNPMPPGGYLRVAEGGEVRQRIDTGDHNGIACMLGGPERRHLFMIDAVTFNPNKTHPGNSRVRVLEVDVPGAGLPG